MAYTWSQLAPTHTPHTRRTFQMALDEVNSKVVMVGGQFAVLTQNALWDGTDWTLSSSGPSDWGTLWSGRMVAWDNANSQVVAFGGTNGAGATNDSTWTWDGATWTLESPADTPGGRRGGVFAYCAALDAPVMFGGTGPSLATFPTDTWKWTGTNWEEITTGASPPGRDLLCGCSFGDGVLTFGGISSVGGISQQTWFFDGTDWAQLSPATTPPTRYEAAMALNPTQGFAVMFGGEHAGSAVRSDTWIYDGVDWTDASPATNPTARYGHAMAFDSNIGCVLLFGGFDGSDETDETWRFCAPVVAGAYTIHATMGLG